MYRLFLLGGVSIRRTSGSLAEGRVSQRRQLALLALLAASPGKPVSREKLVGLMWPEMPEGRARHLLSDTLYVIRQELGRDAVIRVGEGLRLDREVVWSDVSAFETALDLDRLEKAVSLYEGPFLDGFYLDGSGAFERWVEKHRRRLEEGYRGALEALAARVAAAGDRDGSVRWWKRRAASEPTNSRVAMRLMEALAAAGNRAGALEHGRAHQAMLREELGIEPPSALRVEMERLETGVPVPPESSPDEGNAVPARARSGQRPPSGFPGGRRPSTGMQEGSTSRTSRPFTEGRRGALALGFGVVVATVLLVSLVVSSEEGPAADSARLGTTGNAVAVLPLEAHGDAERTRPLAAGLTDDLITRLSRIEGLRVIARDAVERHRRLAPDGCALTEKLGARALLEGSVRSSGERVRANVRLVEPCASSYLWSRSYDRDASDVFAVQADVAINVAHALNVALEQSPVASLDETATRDLHPRDYLTLARAIQMRPKGAEDVAFGEELVRRALAVDPDLGEAYGLMSVFFAMRRRAAEDPTPWDDPKLGDTPWDDSVRAYARRAIALEPSDPSGYRGLQMLHNQRNEHADALEAGLRVLEATPSDHWAMEGIAGTYGAAGDFVRALLWRQLAAHYDPDYAWSYAQRGRLKFTLGDLDGAARWLGMARRLDPDRLFTRMSLAEVESARGRTEAARREISRVLATDPAGQRCGAATSCRVLSRAVAARIELDAGDYEAAKEYLNQLLALDPPVEHVPSGFGEILSVRNALGYAHLQMGEEEVARSILHESRRSALEGFQRLVEEGDSGNYFAYVLARVHALLGDSEAALRWLRAADARAWRWAHAYQGRRDPMLHPLRGNPGFAALADDVDDRLVRKRAELEELEVLPADSLYRALGARARADVERFRNAASSDQ